MLAACGEIGAQPVVLLKPLRWMNVSGGAVRSALCHWSLSPDRLVVACDDVALPDGRIRVRIGGSSGGHKGLASIIEAVGSDAFVRVRVGVGSERDPDQDLSDFVLRPLTAVQHEWYAAVCHVAADAIALAVTRGGFVRTTLRVQRMPGADAAHAQAEDTDGVGRGTHPAAEDPVARLRHGVGGGPSTGRS